jgi:hypothetical protein
LSELEAQVDGVHRLAKHFGLVAESKRFAESQLSGRFHASNSWFLDGLLATPLEFYCLWMVHDVSGAVMNGSTAPTLNFLWTRFLCAAVFFLRMTSLIAAMYLSAQYFIRYSPAVFRSKLAKSLKLVGGLEHVLFSHLLGMSSSQLIHMFSEGWRKTTRKDGFALEQSDRFLDWLGRCGIFS